MHSIYWSSLAFSLVCATCCSSACNQVDRQLQAEESLEELPLHTYASFPVGGAVDISTVLTDAKLYAIASSEFSSITSTNDFKAYSIAKKPDTLDFSQADATADFAEANGQRLFGHALVWHVFTPKWMEALSPSETREFYEHYIDTVVRHFRGRVDGWDVVNEVVNTSGPGLRESTWSQKLGPSYIADAFRIAHAADPAAKLFINDFSTEYDTAKLGTLLRTVEGLRQNGTPIHGIGFQMHLRMDTDTIVLEQSLRRAVETGLLIHISELDIIFNKHDDAQHGGIQVVEAITPELLVTQADKYEAVARIYRRAVPPAQRYGITFWDFTDRDTWIKSFFDVEDWPTIYDNSLQRKPAYAGFRRGVSE